MNLREKVVYFVGPGSDRRHIELFYPGLDPIHIHFHQNPSVIESRVAAVREWLAAIITDSDPPECVRFKAFTGWANHQRIEKKNPA